MPTRVHADPHIPPSRRDHQLRDPLEHLRVIDPMPVGIQVLKATTAPPPRDARRRAIATPQPWDRRAPANAASPSHTVPQYPAPDRRQTSALPAPSGSRRRERQPPPASYRPKSIQVGPRRQPGRSSSWRLPSSETSTGAAPDRQHGGPVMSSPARRRGDRSAAL